MTQDDLKQQAAKHALKFVEEDTIIGIGSGSTVNYFIEALASMAARIEGTVASSEASAKRLRAYGIPVYEFNSVDNIPLYVDGADEVNHHLEMIKGGGAALTREKILATAAQKFVCLADDSKYVSALGTFPLAVEVLPMARSYVARCLVKLGGQPVYREGVTTDNGNDILDVHNLTIHQPQALEEQINHIPGVVCNGIFARRRADILLLAHAEGVEEISRK